MDQKNNPGDNKRNTGGNISMGNYMAPYIIASKSEIKAMFEKDCRDKKRIANGAQHRISGSKSTKVPMSTDNMKRKDWEKLNGEVVTKMDPCTIQTFNKRTDHAKATLLNWLRSEFSADNVMVASMLGSTVEVVDAISKRLEELGLMKPMDLTSSTADKNTKWLAWLAEHNWELKKPTEPKEDEKLINETGALMASGGITMTEAAEILGHDVEQTKRVLEDHGYAVLEAKPKSKLDRAMEFLASDEGKKAASRYMSGELSAKDLADVVKDISVTLMHEALVRSGYHKSKKSNTVPPKTDATEKKASRTIPSSNIGESLKIILDNDAGTLVNDNNTNSENDSSNKEEEKTMENTAKDSITISKTLNSPEEIDRLAAWLKNTLEFTGNSIEIRINA